jgi:hypothetical protein
VADISKGRSMGNFYTNIVLKGVSQSRAQKVLQKRSRPAFISPTHGDVTVVYDEQCDTQDQDEIRRLTSDLSRELDCPAWSVVNHDDDILWYVLYSGGELVDEYDSTPGYFDPKAEPSNPAGGNAERLAATMGHAESATVVEAVLRKSTFDPDGYAFALNRHEDLSKALGIPFPLVCLGYRYIADGDAPADLGTFARTTT